MLRDLRLDLRTWGRRLVVPALHAILLGATLSACGIKGPLKPAAAPATSPSPSAPSPPPAPNTPTPAQEPTPPAPPRVGS